MFDSTDYAPDAERTRRRILADFLRTRRARLAPAQVGLRPGVRRRTPGLRREEVAQLAGMSTSWYTWLEQAREVQPSADTLDDLSAALRLSADEREYLFTLALADRAARRGAEPLVLAERHRQLLASFEPWPAGLLDKRRDVLGFNRAFAALVPPVGVEPPKERNMLRYMFTDADFRRQVVDWEAYVESAVAAARLKFKDLLGDARAHHIVTTLRRMSPEFAALWTRHELRRVPHPTFIMEHPRAGRLSFNYFAMELTELPGATLALDVPRDADTARWMERLVSHPGE